MGTKRLNDYERDINRMKDFIPVVKKNISEQCICYIILKEYLIIMLLVAMIVTLVLIRCL